MEQAASRAEPEDLTALRDEIFPELRGYHLDVSRRESVIEQSPEMREHRSKVRNILKIDKFLDWVQSLASQLLWIDANGILGRSDFNIFFAAPILIIGESNHESTLVLRHICDENSPSELKSYSVLVQALLYQIFQQRPQVLRRRRASLTRECTSDVTALWSLFLECLDEANPPCTFIIIDGIDALKTGASQDLIQEENLLVSRLNSLVNDQTKLVKILLTASLAKDKASSSAGRDALILSRQTTSLKIVQDELALVPHKLNEIHERRCKTVSFAELPLLYGPNTTIYTFENREIRAFVVTEVSGLEPLSLESYTPLHIRAWSVDHNGNHLARRYHDLRVSQFSGQRAIVTLKFIPAGYLPDESEQRLYLLPRGKRWWAYRDGAHHVGIMPENTQVGTKLQTFQY